MSIEKSRVVVPLVALGAGGGVGVVAYLVADLALQPALWLALLAVCLVGVGAFFLFLVAAEWITNLGEPDRPATGQAESSPPDRRKAA